MLKNILTTFGNISGLKCNFDKTSIMPVGNKAAFTQEIIDIGFPVTNSVHLLGLEINDDLSSLTTVHTKTIEKIRKSINFWQRLRLSIPGRLNIAKTLLLGQVNYLGCIITPTPQQLLEMKNLIYSFIQGTMNISVQRVIDSPERGGLGMIDLEAFIKAQQVNWVKRAQLCTKDNWRYNLKTLGRSNIWSIGKTEVDDNNHPILYNIAESYESFRAAFDSVNDNYREAFLLNNPSINYSRQDNRRINLNFFRQEPLIDEKILARLKFRDFYGDNGMRGLAEITQRLNIPLNLATYMRIGASCTNFVQRLPRNRKTDGSSLGIEQYMYRFKQGSKQIRKIFTEYSTKKKDIGNLTHIKSFYRLIGMQVPDEKLVKSFQSSWNCPFYPNKLREFIIKYNGNILGLNTRISHFVADRSRKCTFCTVANRDGNRDETFVHLFFECPSTTGWYTRFEAEYFPEIDFGEVGVRKNFWLCHFATGKILKKTSL